MRRSTFNFACRCVALTWLLIVVPLSQWMRPINYDFEQYYLGGMMVKEGRWDALYPTPVLGSDYNAGYFTTARAKPLYAQRARENGIERLRLMFMQPPPTALMLAPLAFVSFRTAHLSWILLLCVSAAAVILQIEWIAERCIGRATWIAGVLMLVAAGCPSTYRAIRMCNMSLPVAALLGWAAIAMSRRDGARGALAIVLATFTKYIGAVLLPLALIVGRWRTIVWSAAFSVVLTVITLALSGSDVLKEFFTTIVPTLAHGNSGVFNQSIDAFLCRIFNTFPLTPAISATLDLAAILTFIALLALIGLRRQRIGSDPASFFAAATSLIVWLMLFSPICWEHYIVYIFPFWGWLAFEIRSGIVRAVFATFAIVLALVPTMAYTRLAIPEPYDSHIMFANMIILCVAAWRLFSAGTEASQTS